MIRNLKIFARKALSIMAFKSHYKFIIKDWVSLNDLDALSKALESKRFSQNLDPIVVSRPNAKSALVIAPHPDDDVLASGGTMMKLVRTGCRVKVLYLTSGSQRTREESKAVSKDLGTDIEFWHDRAGAIRIDQENIDGLRKVCSQLRPEVVFIPFITDDHDDHRRSAELFYESFKDNKALGFEVWAYQVYSTLLPNVVVDITSEMDEKARLINLWESQSQSRDWAHYVRGMNAINSRFLKTNKARYAESFFVVPAREYVELCSIYFSKQRSRLYYKRGSYK